MVRFELRRRFVRMPRNCRPHAAPNPSLEAGLVEIESSAIRRANALDGGFDEFLRFYDWHYRFFTPTKVRAGVVASYWIASRRGQAADLAAREVVNEFAGSLKWVQETFWRWSVPAYGQPNGVATAISEFDEAVEAGRLAAVWRRLSSEIRAPRSRP
jgi:hypothetical protein